MKRVAILTTGEAPIAEEMAKMLNSGHRYRVGNVPQELVYAEESKLVEALRGEGVDILLLENCDRILSNYFPISVMTIERDETAVEAIRRLMANFPDFTVEQQWANALHEEFDGSAAQTPPPLPPRPAQAAAVENLNNEAGETGFNRKPMPKTYMLWAILATILFSTVPGIIAIVYSTLVSGRYFSGDYEGAVKASRRVEIWTIVSIVVGIITTTLYFPIFLFAGM